MEHDIAQLPGVMGRVVVLEDHTEKEPRSRTFRSSRHLVARDQVVLLICLATDACRCLRMPPLCRVTVWSQDTNQSHMAASKYAKKLLLFSLGYVCGKRHRHCLAPVKTPAANLNTTPHACICGSSNARG